MITPTLASLVGRRALTVCQPYASALLHILPDGHVLKTIENRTWPTYYRGPLLIHAGKSETYLQDLRNQPRFADFAHWHISHTLPMGAILGQVTLVDCISTDAGRQIDPSFASGPWCWVMDDPILFDRPIPCKGALGLWNVLSTSAPTAPHPTGCKGQCSGCLERSGLSCDKDLTKQTSNPQPDLFAGFQL